MTPRFLLLTQDACPDCERLKLMLDKPLRGAYADQIRTVHRQADGAEFEALTAQHGLLAVPVLIDTETGAVLRKTGGLGEVRAFLSGERS